MIAAWIDAGCPIPDEKEGRAITLLFLPGRVDSYPTGTIDGSGSVHKDDTSDSEDGIER